MRPRNDRGLIHFGAVLAMVFAVAFGSCTETSPVRDEVREAVSRLLGSAGGSVGRSEPGFRCWLTPRFYAERGFRPAWVGDRGPGRVAADLLDSVSRAGLEGLDPCDYGWDEARALLFQAERKDRRPRETDPEFLARLDITLTDVFFSYASHLSAGKVDVLTGVPDWRFLRADEGLTSWLEEALARNDIRGALSGLTPQHEYYFALRNALKEARDRRGSCGRVGAEDRNGTQGLLAYDKEDSEARISAIALNLERWRWLPRFLGRRFILIDTGSFRLLLGEDGRVPMSMKVVVGSVPWATPFLRAEIMGFILNPHWDCPASIFYKETINYLRGDKNYLPSNKMVILEGWGSLEQELDPSSLDWTKVSPATHPRLHLRQLPGPLNILGRLKFVMPNPDDVFLHDTPYQEDFKQSERIFSHGCIRAEKPFDLAAHLARSTVWTKEAVLAALKDTREREVNLDEPVPIYVSHFTAWPGMKGRIEFRRDVYGRDEELAKALAEHAPAR